MFCRIFLCVIVISETILGAFSDNELLNTLTLENNNTFTKHPTNAQGPTPSNFHHVSQSNDEVDDRTSILSFRRDLNDHQTVILKKILARWRLMKNKSKNQVPVLKAHELPDTTEEGFIDKPPTNQVQIPIKRDDDILTPAHFVPRPWWMQSQIEISSTANKNVQLTTESIKLKKEKEKQTITLSKFDAIVDNDQWKTESEERKQFKPIHPIPEPWLKQYVIGDMNDPNPERENQQLSSTTEKELPRETYVFQPWTTQRTQTLQPEQVNIQTTTAPQQSIYQNWALLLFDSKANKQFEEEHNQLENEHQRNRNQPEVTSQFLLESAEVDDDRNMALRQRVETWYSNLQSRRNLPNLRHSHEMGKVMRFRRDLQRRQVSKRRSHAVDHRRNRWRRQLLNQYSMPQAVDYRRLLSLWRNELRRQLQIKWNRRPLVEISPGAFKTDIHVNPPDDLAKHMQKLLALKKRQEEKNIDLNAGREVPE